MKSFDVTENASVHCLYLISRALKQEVVRYEFGPKKGLGLDESWSFLDDRSIKNSGQSTILKKPESWFHLGRIANSWAAPLLLLRRCVRVGIVAADHRQNQAAMAGSRSSNRQRNRDYAVERQPVGARREASWLDMTDELFAKANRQRAGCLQLVE